METRRLLQIVLGMIVAAIILIGAALVYELTRSPDTVVIQKTFEQKKANEPVEKNPWEDRGDEAIQLVAKKRAENLDEQIEKMFDEKRSKLTLEDVLKNDRFVEEKLKLKGPESKGWRAEWWGETKYGPYFYLVRYAFEDANVTVGPEWLVNLKKERVVPKNIGARVATNPEEAVHSEYYDNDERVVSAMVQHTFESGITLGGNLLVYFEGRTQKKQKATVLGWTIQHDRGPMYKAYFQWVEAEQPKYAQFEFDYEKKALKAVNLHAANIMRAGRSFEGKEAVNVLPNQFDPDADRPSEQWSGSAAKAYDRPEHRGKFEALGTVLNERQLITALEWLIRARAKTPEEFEACKKKKDEKKPDCRWETSKKKEGVYRVTYIYDLGDAEKPRKIPWTVYLERDSNPIEPVGRLSKLAYRAVHARD